MPRKRVKIPPLEPRPEGLTDEEKKGRQRLHVKRAYYKKLIDMQALRDNAHALKRQLDRLIAQTKAEDGTEHFAASPRPGKVDILSDSDVSADIFTSSFDLGFDLEDDLVSGLVGGLAADLPPADATALVEAPSTTLRNLYTEIVITKRKLDDEQTMLRQAIAEHESFSQELARFVKPAEDSYDELPTGSVLTTPPRLVAPISVAFCHNLARSSLQDMRRYRENQNFITSGASVFGWRDKRITVEDRVKFSLKKTFQDITPLALALRGWGVLSFPKPLASLFSASLNCQIYPLQVVDEDNKVMLRVMSAHDGMLLVKTAFLVTRFAIPNGFVIFVKSIDPSVVAPQVPRPGTIEKWVEHCTWITFEKGNGDDDSACRLEFGGEVQINPMAGSSWILEILFIVLRFEGKVQGPIFSIC